MTFATAILAALLSSVSIEDDPPRVLISGAWDLPVATYYRVCLERPIKAASSQPCPAALIVAEVCGPGDTVPSRAECDVAVGSWIEGRVLELLEQPARVHRQRRDAAKYDPGVRSRPRQPEQSPRGPRP